jgi:hypothetical protein
VVQDLATTVQSFFDQALVAGLLLPDGWFGGRPMETHHRLTFVVHRPNRLLIELDERMLLSFSGAPAAEVKTLDLALADGTATLVISGFQQCVVEFLEYGSDAPHVASYTDDRVCFVAPT